MLDLIFIYRAEVQTYGALILCLAMLRWGGGPERAVALTWLIGIEAVDWVYHAISGANYVLESIDPFHAALDVAVAIAFVIIALYANRLYPLVIAAFQLLSATSHLTRELVESITPIAYAVMVFAPSWGILVAMILGFARHLRRRKEFGDYRGWRGQPPFFLGRLCPSPAS
ncbi:hypothetical protein P7228_08930 [Altererythrobacter arenosus]|uniref:Uncharacterized protein n=1 Tax=Altererythrobacter arenosus TaxID=3032592 RepID=A0ABY8FMP7_9SPHN|nr:hypothetical protein [Altererythrobacter sp. CAU 1644]WFL76127.1 hypothetical protein P7228_08930 [Altererythrobacter sp. CAU 1644]